MKKVPLRKCLATNTMLPKEELFRVVITKEGQVFLDLTGKANGRGAYISKNVEAITLAKKKSLLDRAFNTKVNPSIYDELLKNL